MDKLLTKKDLEKIDNNLILIEGIISNTLQKYYEKTPKTQQGVVAFWEIHQIENKIHIIRKLLDMENKVNDN